MIKDIKYNGFTTTPSDYECPDGDLCGVKDAAIEEGSVKPVFPPETKLVLAAGQSVIFIHRTSKFTHYIVHDSTSNLLSWIDSVDKLQKPLPYVGNVVLNSLNAIGNTLLALCDDGIHYYLWKPDDVSYLYLGTKIPECPISFGIQGESILYSKFMNEKKENQKPFKIEFKSFKLSTTDPGVTLDNENKKLITNQILGKVNAFISKILSTKNEFIYPFFIRYAYRLYDLSLTNHSAPILIIPHTGCSPWALWTDASSHVPGSSVSSAEVDLFAIGGKIDYKPLLNQSGLNELKSWSDIVKSIDIFISSPIYTYDQNGDIESINMKGNQKYGKFVGKYIGGDNLETEHGLIEQAKIYYQVWPMSRLLPLLLGDSISSFDLPAVPEEKLYGNIRDCKLFYKIDSIDINDLTTERKLLDLKEGSLSSIVTKEVMGTDYQTHDTLCPDFSYVYNSRLNIANIKRTLFEGFDTSSMLAYTNGFQSYDPASKSITDKTQLDFVFLYTQLEIEGKTIVVKNKCSLKMPINNIVMSINHKEWKEPVGFYFFYPDASAKKMFLSTGNESKMMKMEEHMGMNGAFFFDGKNFSTHAYAYVESHDTLPEVTTDNSIDLPNKMYTSEVNNPFFFPLQGIKTIGTGEIIGICAAVKALSEGQFGQFPLYAFTTEGVWSLQIRDDGTFLPSQPTTLDVCINPKSITQMENTVLFATDRGIMLLSGANSTCISDILDGDTFDINSLEKIDKVVQATGIDKNDFSYIPFKEFIKECEIVYDYKNQRIVVFNKNQTYAYMFSLKSKTWGIISSDLAGSINSYPEALAMTTDNRMVDMDGDASGISAQKSVIITRPLKLDAPDSLKSVNAIIQRGVFEKGHVKQVLFGSRDLIHWFPIATSIDHYLRGFSANPYKYFKLMLICDLGAKETVYGCSVDYDIRHTDKIR